MYHKIDTIVIKDKKQLYLPNKFKIGQGRHPNLNYIQKVH
jgi:hypothetical protein